MRPLIALAAVLAFAGSLFAETRIVSTTSQGKTKTTATEVREVAEGGGLRILQNGEEGSASTLLAPDGTVMSAEYRTKEGTVSMVSDGAFVTTAGTWNGKPVAGKCELKGVAFYGSGFEFAARALARNKLASLKFAMIQPAAPTKSTVMELSAEGREGFKSRSAIKVKWSLPGAMSAFWSARLLVDEDGTVLRYAGNQGPGTAEMVTELVEVRR